MTAIHPGIFLGRASWADRGTLSTDDDERKRTTNGSKITATAHARLVVHIKNAKFAT